MARSRQPIDLLLVKGKKHLTQQEIEDRRAQETKALSQQNESSNIFAKRLKKRV
ncbi:hypothetical protein AAHT66_16945 [Bacillus inaquosorum]|uniref:hypothetical protein n=1 Tax=Bacillus sp. 0209A TaxID=3120562 RepID=UPI00202A9237|nr:hypothetical protein [Bacillus subtilis]